jgi:hypothetical protein
MGAHVAGRRTKAWGIEHALQMQCPFIRCDKNGDLPSPVQMTEADRAVQSFQRIPAARQSGLYCTQLIVRSSLEGRDIYPDPTENISGQCPDYVRDADWLCDPSRFSHPRPRHD